MVCCGRDSLDTWYTYGSDCVDIWYTWACDAVERALFAPGKTLTVPFRVDLIWCALHLSSKTLGMTIINAKFRRFMEMHHDFVKKGGLSFELKCLRPRREIAN